MAIDSAEKRRSLVGIITGVMSIGVTPNASKDKEWRQQSGWGYSGIVPNGDVAPTINILHPISPRRRRRSR